MTNPENWDAIGVNEKPGVIVSAIDMNPTQVGQTIGFPYGAYGYGCLITFISLKVANLNEAYRNAQIYIPHYNGADINRYVYVRTFRDTTSGGTRCWRVIDISSTTTSVVV